MKPLQNSSTPRSVGPSVKSGEGVKVEYSLTVDKDASEIYVFWRNFENLPRFMNHLESVREKTPAISHWVIKTDKGVTLEWDSQIIEERRNEMISWQSLPEAAVENAGSVWFTPAAGGRGTVVKFSMKYAPPGGKIGAVIAKLMGEDPKKYIVEDLRRFKSLMETGEIPTTEGQSVGNQKSKR